MHTTDIIIAGAGPVGLLLANLLGARGVRTLVFERRRTAETRSMAIGIMPPSLEILRTVQLDAECVRRGTCVRRVVVHARRRQLGDLDFDRIPSAYPFVLCLPQAETMAILEAGARRFDCVTIQTGVEIVSVAHDASGVRIRGRDGCESGARFLVGADGHASSVRELLGVGVRRRRLEDAFLMADFDDDGALGDEAHLYFTEAGSVEAFPLSRGRRRWIAMTDGLVPVPAPGLLEGLIRERAHIRLSESHKTSESAFSVNQYICDSYVQGRVALCGDAAHVMSPIGGQGMNTGFADAALLADVLVAALGGAPYAPLLCAYDRERRRAFHAAARLARSGMWLGTRQGGIASALRSACLAHILLRPPVRDWLAATFAMVTGGRSRRINGGTGSAPYVQAADTEVGPPEVPRQRKLIHAEH